MSLETSSQAPGFDLASLGGLGVTPEQLLYLQVSISLCLSLLTLSSSSSRTPWLPWVWASRYFRRLE